MEGFLLAVVVTLTLAAYLWGGVSYLGMRFAGQLNPGVFPTVIGSLGLLLALAFLAMATREWRNNHFKVVIEREVAEALIWMFLFVGVLGILGFAITTALFGFLFLLRFYARKWYVSAALSLAITGVLYVVFVMVFEVPLPVFQFQLF